MYTTVVSFGTETQELNKRQSESCSLWKWTFGIREVSVSVSWSEWTRQAVAIQDKRKCGKGLRWRRENEDMGWMATVLYQRLNERKIMYLI